MNCDYYAENKARAEKVKKAFPEKKSHKNNFHTVGV